MIIANRASQNQIFNEDRESFSDEREVSLLLPSRALTSLSRSSTVKKHIFLTEGAETEDEREGRVLRQSLTS